MLLMSELTYTDTHKQILIHVELSSFDWRQHDGYGCRGISDVK